MSGTYLGATEITARLPAAVSIGTNTHPITLSEVASWIQGVGAGVNAAAAAAGYAVPITPSSEDAYAQVREIVADGVTCKILRVLAPHVTSSTKQTTIAETYCKAYEQAMKDLREGKLILPDAPQDTTGTGRELPRSWETSGGEATLGGASPMMSTRTVW